MKADGADDSGQGERSINLPVLRGCPLWTTPKPSSPIVIRLTGDRLYSNAAWPGYVINTEMGDELSNPDQPIIIGIVLIPTVLVPSFQSQT